MPSTVLGTQILYTHTHTHTHTHIHTYICVERINNLYFFNFSIIFILGDFPGASVIKNLPATDAGDTGLIPGLERSPEEGNGKPLRYSFLFSFIFISWRLITLQYYSGFCHTLTWISHGFTCVPHPDPPSHLPLHPIPLGLPSAPGPSACFMHPTWAGDLFHYR